MANLCDTCGDSEWDLLLKILAIERDSFDRLQQLISVTAAGGGGGGGASNLTGINGVAPSVGCGVSTTGTLRVAQASDCAFPLPTGAATAANQATANASLAAIDAGIPVALGQTTMAASMPVVIASDQSAISVSSATTSVIPGTGATNLGKAEDAATASGDVGVGILLKRSDTAATQTSADGDYSLPVVNANGQIRVGINRTFQVSDTNDILKAEDAAHASGDAGVFVLGVANEAQTTLAADGDYIALATDIKGNHLVVGNLAHDAVDAGNPVKMGGQARTTLPTAVADADRSNIITDKFGRQIVQHGIRDLRGNQQTTITSSTTETTIVTADASNMQDLYGLVIANTSATAVAVTIKDSTAGTTRFVIQVPAGDTRGFMLPACDGHKQAAVNNNWTATCSASVASVQITALIVKNTS